MCLVLCVWALLQLPGPFQATFVHSWLFQPGGRSPAVVAALAARRECAGVCRALAQAVLCPVHGKRLHRAAFLGVTKDEAQSFNIHLARIKEKQHHSTAEDGRDLLSSSRVTQSTSHRTAPRRVWNISTGDPTAPLRATFPSAVTIIVTNSLRC